MNNNRKTITLKQTPKPKLWSHQDELRSLTGKVIIVKLNNGETMRGRLSAADQFTIKLDVLNLENSVLLTKTIYKSAMTYYSAEA